AAKHALVETNLSSNEDVLGMVGENHPLPIYRKSGVPVTLSTDDERIERIDLTHEWRGGRCPGGRRDDRPHRCDIPQSANRRNRDMLAPSPFPVHRSRSKCGLA